MIALFCLLVAAVPTPAEKKEIANVVRSEQLGALIEDSILRIDEEKPIFILPVRNTWLKPNPLSLYFYRKGERPQGLANMLANEPLVFKSVVSMVEDGKDFVITAKFTDKAKQEVERSAKFYRGRGVGFSLKSNSNLITLAPDCKPVALSKVYAVRLCKTDFIVNREGEEAARVSIGEADQVILENFNLRGIAFVHEGGECSVAKVLRLRDGKIIADSGCRDDDECHVTVMPSEPRECRGTIACTSGKKQSFDLCK